MAGVLLESLSNRNLILFFSVLFLVQTIFFLIGGLICPEPNNVQQLLGNICHDPTGNASHKWFARSEDSCSKLLNNYAYTNYEKWDIKDGREVVFSYRFPIPKEGKVIYMSPWHQNMVAVFRIDFSSSGKEVDEVKMPKSVFFDAKLGYKDVGQSEWTTISSYNSIQRPLYCTENSHNNTVGNLEHECNMVPLLELGSVQHQEYLINIIFPTDNNPNLGRIEDIWVYVIHQNGGFTFVWFTIKTILFPILAITLLWYIWKMSQLNRKPNVLERTLLAVGSAITLLNFPLDWLTLKINMPFMLLYSDIRQGLFYSVLLCFWIIFSGEHRMDQVKRDSLSHYTFQLGAVACCCVFMFLFDICERGFQLANPFFSIWSTESGSIVALSFMILAGISAAAYLVYLLISVAQVFNNICIKRSALSGMSKPRQKYYRNLIYRFSFLMVFTLVCAAMTMVVYLLGQAQDTIWMWNTEVHLTSAVQTGVYGMWNIYVFCLLILYSPSMKYTPIVPIETSSKDEVEFSIVPSDTAILKDYIQKSAVE